MYKKCISEKMHSKYYNKNIIIRFIFLCYILTAIYVTFFSGRLQYETINLRIFRSYFDLFASFSYRQWFQIIANILLFMPFGLMLPFISKKFSKLQPLFLTALALSGGIEMMQGITKRGVFDIDDMINNMLGAFLGFYCYKIFSGSEFQKLKNNIVFAILSIGIITIYSLPIIDFYREGMGNITEYVYRGYDMNSVSIENTIQFSENAGTEKIYKSQRMSIKEADNFATEFFNQLGYELDSSQTSKYEDGRVYYSADRDICLWVYYLNSNFWYQNFGENRQLNHDINTTLRFLSALGISVPNNLEIQESSDGYTTIHVNNMFGERLEFGNISIKTDQRTETLKYNIVNGYSSKEVPIISEQEAFDRLQRGEFYLKEPMEMHTLLIEEVKKSFTLDTKGYLQPIYIFQTKVNHSNDIQSIIIPAVAQK